MIARAVAATALLTLMLAPAAGAHATVTPVQVEAGRPQLLLVTLPNDNFRQPLGLVRITLPVEAEPLSAEPVESRWRVRIDDRTVEFRGGPIAAGSTASFRLRARFELIGNTGLQVEERYAALGQSARYTVPFLVTPPARTDDGRGGVMVLVAIGIFGALAAATGFFVLARWLRG